MELLAIRQFAKKRQPSGWGAALWQQGKQANHMAAARKKFLACT